MKKNVYRTNTILKQVSQMANCSTNVIIEDNTKIKVGVDLGTSSIVLVVVDESNHPVFVASEDASVVADGLVVNFMEAISIVKRLKNKAENQLQRPVTLAAGAVPPGTVGNNKKIIENVIHGAGMEVTEIFDEPTAAAAVLNIQDGAVVDIGGGTTGISIFNNGKVAYSGDEATGGTHMTLVLAGHYGLTLEEGEILKRDSTKYDENFLIMQPVAEKMASITKKFLDDYGKKVKTIYLVGGMMMYPQFTRIFKVVTQLQVIQPNHPKYVTPLGIALKSTAF
ncbi:MULTISPECIES: ethanolamine utilization protein EutJ [Virgibacillus]|nr:MULTISPECIES: ethanolamine utilization protein EutJ [Virgibacillus]MBS7428369.1 ethanolamine utilization protein EutJ [Virgibacillus sp. 19R1-5]MBU8565197.1 ethanolamine utilization protein EutJ [Virgibacillus pantothenticus]MBU8601481.1 ethanolamine utilization protein EutJ [Virgibacillus pantothenticus]MBU8633516.1 ethanolamine utilization protein EutJ [Virgibacillus pantothenticus]MBU8643390.1 ethanolamine utilization protein EutJ [Virgibacillus pantothenticus]